MATVAIDIGTLIGRTPGLHGGVPHIVGKGITVRRIVSWYQRGLMPEEVVHRIGHVTLAEVYAALTYYHANRGNVLDRWIAFPERSQFTHYDWSYPQIQNTTQKPSLNLELGLGLLKPLAPFELADPLGELDDRERVFPAHLHSNSPIKHI
jgi:uncharacterized protein (DUF433 family)